MRDNLDECLTLIFGSEGGYVNHPKDPGGATKYGITAATLGAHRGLGRSATPNEVKALSLAEATRILEAQYARSIRFDDLPAGIDYAVLDFAVNSGPAQAAKTLQRALGVNPDGVIGERTIEAIMNRQQPTLINLYCDERLVFLKKLKTWSTFGKGWSRRVSEVRAGAIKMSRGSSVLTPVTAGGTAKALSADTKASATSGGKGSIVATIGVATTTVSATTDKLAPLAGAGNKLVDYAFTALTVAGVLLSVVGIALVARSQLRALRSGAPV